MGLLVKAFKLSGQIFLSRVVEAMWPGFVAGPCLCLEFLLGVFLCISHSDLICALSHGLAPELCKSLRCRGSVLVPCEDAGLGPPMGCGHRPGSKRSSSALSTWENEGVCSSTWERRLIF